MSESSKPSWRRGSSSSAPRAATGGKGWQHKRPKVSQSAASTHRAKLVGLGLVVLALAGYFAFKVFFLHIQTPLLVFAVAHYPQPLPVNALALEDASRLAGTNTENLQALQPSGIRWTREELLRQFDQLPDRGGGPDKNVVLIYLSAHGALNDAAEPCLILPDSSPTDAGTWVRIAEVVERIQKKPAIRFVLLLDSGRVADEWSLGVFDNAFCQRIEEQFAEAPVANLQILSANSAGERSWTAPELGTSAFAHFVARGLSDDAADRDSIVTLRELTDYLSEQVAAWVAQNRASRQTPRLLTPLPADQDWPLAYRGSSRDPRAEDLRQRIASDWAVVHKLWADFETEWRERRLLQYEPVAAARMQRLLLRMETLLQGGTAYRGDFVAAQTEFRTLLADSVPRTRLPADLRVYSTPLAKHLSGPSRASAEYDTLAQKWLAAKGKPPLKEGDPPLPQLDQAEASQLAWQFIRQLSGPTRAQLRDALTLVDEAAGRTGAATLAPETCELLFLRMADAHIDQAEPSADFPDPLRRYLQSVLAARELAEDAAAPADERCHYWVQFAVDQADQRRRLAEDALFCDGLAAAEAAEVERLISTRFSFVADYRGAVQQAERLAQAYSLRDQVWAGLPFLAQWLLASDEEIREQVLAGDGSPAAAAELLREIAGRNQQLGAAIDQALTADDLDFRQLDEQVAGLQSVWKKLLDPFTVHCQHLKDRAGQTRETLRDIAAVLQVPSPWLQADEREKLADKLQSILFARAGNPAAGASTGSLAKTTEQDGKPPAAYGKGGHPLLNILARDRLALLLNIRTPETAVDDAGDATAQQARQGARVRRWLTDLRSAARDLEDVTNRRLEESRETAANLRAGISEADRLVRASAAIQPWGIADPAHRLRRLDLHLLLLWHARRTLDDFWGPTPGSPPGSPSYFASVTESYLADARRLENRHQTLTHRQINLQQLLGDRLTAVSATRVEPQDVTSLGEATAAAQQIHIDWHEALARPGVAALYLSDSQSGARDHRAKLIPVIDNDARPWRRRPLPVGASESSESASSDVVQRIAAAQLAAMKSEQELTAHLFYRGHILSRPFSVRNSTPVVVNVDPRTPRNAKLVVRGEGNRRAFIVFVFDCSRSMEARANPAAPSRIEKAKAAFRQVLDSLPRDSHYQVAMRAYGRRAGYGRSLEEIHRLPDAPPNLDPNDDVELMVDMAQFDDEQHAAITRRFGALSPLGVTPLYRAIQTTLTDDDFNLADSDDIKQVIVISDGINEQYSQLPTTLDAVLGTIRNHPRAQDVRVDVVLFEEAALRQDGGLQERLRARGQNLAQELENVKTVARATGGDFFSADNPQELVEVLRQTLKLVKYSVTPVGQSPSSQQLDLEQEWPLTDLPPEERSYIVRLHGAPNPAEQTVRIAGGESLELRYDRSQDRLVFPEYKRGDARDPIDGLVDRHTNEEYRMLPILPRKNLQRVEFEVAIQNRDRLKFTPRPPHVWAYIQPVDENEQPAGFPEFHFYDAEFAPDTPVPVFRFVVPNWPSNAPKAALQMWVKFASPPLEINGATPVADLQPSALQEDIPQVSFRGGLSQVGDSGAWRLTVWEDHEPQTGLFKARVQVSPPPDQLRHLYFVEVGQVKHEFDFLQKPAPTVLITSRERLTQSALVVPRVVMIVQE